MAAGRRLLYLLRHAKSSWDDPRLDDPDRPLARRGLREAARLADHVRRERIAPALVLCSTSLRTRQTLAAVLPALQGDIEIRIEEALYAASSAELLERLRSVPDAVPSVMLVGHNPGLHELTVSLAASAGELGPPLDHLPTAALVTLEIAPGSWSLLTEGAAEVAAFVTGREL